MKIFIFLLCCASIVSIAQGQKGNLLVDHTLFFTESLTQPVSNVNMKSPGVFYESELCMSSINTGTFYAFMDWLKDKIHYPGMQAGILHDGELVWKGNWGLASIEEGKPVNDSTVFRLLSVSKTFVGTAMMKLVEDGLIDLNGDINDYLPFDVINPYYPQSVATPKMVLSHTASLADYCAGSGPECNKVEYFGDPQVSLHDYLESHFVPGGICYDDMSYYNEPPGTYCYYSNPGAALGGYIVESVAGKGFNEYCNDSIFSLLDMPTSRWYYSELDSDIVADMYLWNGSNYTYYGARSYAGYPLGDLKSNVTQLANFVKMYINHGNYNGITLLDSTTVEMMTTINDTVLPWSAPIGLIWWYEPYDNLWYHDGATGSCIAFNKDKKTGFVFADNSRIWSAGPHIYALVHFQMIFSELVVSVVHTDDTDQDDIIEAGETVEVVIGVFNNLMEDAEDVSLTLRCSDPAFMITDSVATLGTIPAGQSALNQSQPFKFQASGIQNPHTVMMDVEVNFNNDQTILIHFPLFAGQADLLLVKDERDVFNSERFYLDVLDSLGYATQYWDIDVNGNPDTSFLKNFPVVIWYTGYDEDATISETNQNVLISYLDNGGRLFLTGQNISDEIGNSVFMNDYLHADHASNVSYYIITGIAGDPLSDGLQFLLNEGDGLDNQYSQSALNPLNGGEPCLRYNGMSSYPAGVRYENDTYKTVFLSFGFEGMRQLSDRHTLMQRILAYFDVHTGADDSELPVAGLYNLRLLPNPVKDFLTVSYTLSVPQDVTITLYDVMGKVVLNEVIQYRQPGKQSMTLNLNGYEAGLYFYRMTVNGDPCFRRDMRRPLLSQGQSTGKLMIVR